MSAARYTGERRREPVIQRSWTRTVVLDGLILTGWMVSVGMVVLHEHGQLFGGVGNPTTSLVASIESKSQWFGIYYQGQKIGFSQTTLMPDESQGIPGVTVDDRGQLSFNLLGTPQRIEATAHAFIDASWRVQQFSATLKTATTLLQWSGRRNGDELLVTVTTPTSVLTKRLRDPTGGAFVNGLSSWAAFHRLRVGQSGKAWLLNPLALNPEMVYFTVRRLETFVGKPAYVVETDVRGLTTTSWVTPDGEVLRETSPLGWELRQEPRAQAVTVPNPSTPAQDLLSATAVPLNRPLDVPGRIVRLTLLVEGLGPHDVSVQRPWQRVLPPETLRAFGRTPPSGVWCVMQLDRPVRTHTVEPLPASLKRYVRPSVFVQSEDARIETRAAKIIGTRSDPWERMAALNQWVYRTLRKRLTVGLPSAVDILNTPEGDCHEHTVLFTALARSVGLPTRMVAGLVYSQGALFYHAWPEVWLGTWIPTDPTLGQLVADATHFGLIEAENEALIGLGQYVGRLRVDVLAVDEQVPADVPAQAAP